MARPWIILRSSLMSRPAPDPRPAARRPDLSGSARPAVAALATSRHCYGRSRESRRLPRAAPRQGPVDHAPRTRQAPASASASERASARLLAGLLLLAGVLVGVCPLIGVVTTADGSPTGAVTIAAFTAVLPGLLAVALAVTRPTLGLAATAGAGLIGLARLFADLAVLTETDGVTRPELFYETTDRARPFATTGRRVAAAGRGSADGGRRGAGRRTAGPRRRRGFRAGPEPLFGSAPDPAIAARPGGRRSPDDRSREHAADDVGARAERATGRTPRAEPADDRRRLPRRHPADGRCARNALQRGLSHAAGAAARGQPDRRAGRRAAAAARRASALSLPRPCLDRSRPRCWPAPRWRAAVPPLTAVVAVLAGAPTSVSSSAWWGLAGAVVLASAGLLARRRGSVRRSFRRATAARRRRC